MSLNKKETVRYSRHILLDEIGLDGQQRIKDARILIVGAGGLGCPAAMYLAAAGVGTIGIIDFDVVEESNLQRQVLFGESSLGVNKAIAAEERLNDLNPLVKIQAIPERLENKNGLDILKDYDIIVDGTDNFATRYLVNDACIILDKPLVYGSVYRFEGQVSVFNYEGGPSYRCLFPAPPDPDTVLNCAEIGVLGVIPGLIGMYQANEVMKLMTKVGEPLSGKLLLINALTNQTSWIEISRNEDIIMEVLKNKDKFEEIDYEFFCNPESKENPVNEITVSELRSMMDSSQKIRFLDVRESDEMPVLEQFKDIHIPLGEVADQTGVIDKDNPTVVFCQTGVRSKKAIRKLQEKYQYPNLLNLKGGLLGWLEKYGDNLS